MDEARDLQNENDVFDDDVCEGDEEAEEVDDEEEDNEDNQDNQDVDDDVNEEEEKETWNVDNVEKDCVDVRVDEEEEEEEEEEAKDIAVETMTDAECRDRLQAAMAKRARLQEAQRAFHSDSARLQTTTQSTRADVARARATGSVLFAKVWANIIERYTLLARLHRDDTARPLDEWVAAAADADTTAKAANELERHARPGDIDKQIMELRGKFNSFVDGRAASATCVCESQSQVCSLHEITMRVMCASLGVGPKNKSVQGALKSVREDLEQKGKITKKKNQLVFRVDGVYDIFIPALGQRERKHRKTDA